MERKTFYHKKTLICGNGGSGKTTLVNKIIEMLPAEAKIIRLDKSTEKKVFDIIDRESNINDATRKLKYIEEALPVLYRYADRRVNEDDEELINELLEELSKLAHYGVLLQDKLNIPVMESMKHQLTEFLSNCDKTEYVFVDDGYTGCNYAALDCFVFCSSLTIICTTQSVSDIKPQHLSRFNNVMLIDKSNIEKFIKRKTNFCQKIVVDEILKLLEENSRIKIMFNQSIPRKFKLFEY